MVSKLMFMFIFVLPIIFYAQMLHTLAKEKRKHFLIFNGLSSMCSLPLYAFVFSRFEYPLIEIYGFLILAIFVKAIRSVDKSESVPKRKFVMPLLTLATSLYVAAAEYKVSPTSGFNLDRPIDSDELIIGKGGHTIFYNHHIVVERQKNAIDIATRIGFHEVWGMFAGDLKRFRVFGKNILSPCQGKVISSRVNLVDQVPGFIVPSPPEGNAVELECADSSGRILVFRYAHLERDSTKLVEGDTVKLGDVIGRVGNTGNTSWPHLHIDIIEKVSGAPVPILFEGKYLRAGNSVP